MKNAEINKSIKEMRIQLTRSELIDFWLNFVLLLIPITLCGYVAIDTALKHDEFPYVILALVAIIIMFVRNRLSSRQLFQYRTSLTEVEFKQANMAASKLNDWRVLSNQKNYFSTIRSMAWQWDGIRVTSILKDGRIYLNSMVSPSPRSNPFTFGVNSRMKFDLIRQYKLILDGKDVAKLADQELAKREEAFWQESELSSTNLIAKFIGYPIGIALVVLCIHIIEDRTVPGVIIGLTTIGFVCQYFYYDLKIIIEKERRKRPGYNRLR